MKKSFHTYYRPISRFLGALGCLFLLAGCGQDPIFYHISYEEAPVDPIIEGGPGKIVADGDTLYVSNGSVFKYTYTAPDPGSWTALGGDPGRVYDVAVVNGVLYCMTLNGVWQRDNNTWVPITNDTEHSSPQSIFGAGDQLFVGALRSGSAEDFAILYKDGDKFSRLTKIKGSLSGAVMINNNTYYLATQGDGILAVSKTAVGQDISPQILAGTEDGHFMGLLELDGSGDLAAATRGGAIFYGKPDNLQSVSYGATFTRAFALWKDPNTGNKLLLVGLGSGSSTGYREIPVRADGSLGPSLQVPGEGTGGTTVSNTAKYNSSLQKQAVNAIFMAPQEVSVEGTVKYPVIFASTQKSGLWVYRDGSWKAQE
jgi:hypothetical protein